MGIQFPERYGGAAMGAVEYCICVGEGTSEIQRLVVVREYLDVPA